ncbi:hypothetical protein TNCV_69461 [Trichonephila clavipes]|nr:hypothetical protein TNCV_69461 [Trichonephila clavipes]
MTSLRRTQRPNGEKLHIPRGGELPIPFSSSVFLRTNENIGMLQQFKTGLSNSRVKRICKQGGRDKSIAQVHFKFPYKKSAQGRSRKDWEWRILTTVCDRPSDIMVSEADCCVVGSELESRRRSECVCKCIVPLRHGDSMLTKYQLIKFIDFCEVWFMPESVAEVATIIGDRRCHTLRH